MGALVDESSKLAHAGAVIAALGLHRVRHSIVGDEQSRGVSGGERKRLNIGIELAAAPLLLLLDEPTSGLDSSAALELCLVNACRCDHGQTVFITLLIFVAGSESAGAYAAHCCRRRASATLGNFSTF